MSHREGRAVPSFMLEERAIRSIFFSRSSDHAMAADNNSGPITLPAPRKTRYGVLRAAPFTGDTTLPEKVDVVIIGGGINGASAAWHLARRGVSVLLCEKAEIGCEASSRAFGWISELMNEPAKMELIHESKRQWKEMAGQVGETGYRVHGIYNLAEDEATAELHEGWFESVRGLLSADTRLLTSREAADHFPTASARFCNGLYAPSDGAAEPIIATAAIAEAARAAGAHVVTGCAVRGLDLAGGATAGVFTEKGYVKASTVLCAANAWSRIFCGNHGIDLPQLYLIMTMARTNAIAGPEAAGGPHSWAWRKQIDGSYSLGGVRDIEVPMSRDAFALRKQFAAAQEHAPPIKLSFGKLTLEDWRISRRWNPRSVSPFEKHRLLEGRPAAGFGETSLAGMAACFPEMARATIAETWSGALTITPDDMPVASGIDAIPGFHVLTGCSFGITWAPALGKMMADIMTGAKTSIDPSPFRFSRFTD